MVMGRYNPLRILFRNKGKEFCTRVQLSKLKDCRLFPLVFVRIHSGENEHVVARELLHYKFVYASGYDILTHKNEITASAEHLS